MKTKILIFVTLLITFVGVSGVWEQITDPDLPITVSNKYNKTIQLCGENIKTNQTLDLGTKFSREVINQNIKQLYDLYIAGKITITNAGLIPVKNF